MKTKTLLATMMLTAASFAPAGEEWMANGSFEKGMEGWRYFSMKGEVERMERSTQYREGDEGLTMKFVKPETEKLMQDKYGAWGRVHTIPPVPVEAGKTYTASAYFYADDGFDGNVSLLVRNPDGSGAVQTFGNGQVYGKWQRLAIDFKPAGTGCEVFLNAFGNKGEVSWDDVSVVEAAAGGSSNEAPAPAAPASAPAPTPTPASAASGNGSLRNGDFADGLAPWALHQAEGKVDGRVVDAPGAEGKKAYAMTAVENGPNGKAWARIHQTVDLKPGAKYLFSCRVMTDADFAAGEVPLWIRDVKTGANLRTLHVGPTRGQWTEQRGEFTTGAEGKTIVYLNMMGQAGTVYFGDVAIVPAE